MNRVGLRRGLLGGTFDPIHLGHLVVAEAARDALALDAITLLPAPVPPHRGAPVASAPHRFAMAALAIQDVPYLTLSDVEFDSPGPSYTDTTLDRLAARGIDTTALFFIIGADAFRDIASWKNFPVVLDRCHFVVVSRPGAPVGGLREALPALADRMLAAPCTVPAEPCIFLVDAPTPPVSSTAIRERLVADRSIAGLVPAPVMAYIERHELYGPSTGAA
jgi:nicotinate-nucleotide adenylyltransferase